MLLAEKLLEYLSNKSFTKYIYCHRTSNKNEAKKERRKFWGNHKNEQQKRSKNLYQKWWEHEKNWAQGKRENCIQKAKKIKRFRLLVSLFLFSVSTLCFLIISNTFGGKIFAFLVCITLIMLDTMPADTILRCACGKTCLTLRYVKKSLPNTLHSQYTYRQKHTKISTKRSTPVFCFLFFPLSCVFICTSFVRFVCLLHNYIHEWTLSPT